VLSHWHNGVLTGFFSNDQTSDNLIVQGQECRMDVVILPMQNFRWPLLHTLECSIVMEEQHIRHFYCWI